MIVGGLLNTVTPDKQKIASGITILAQEKRLEVRKALDHNGGSEKQNKRCFQLLKRDEQRRLSLESWTGSDIYWRCCGLDWSLYLRDLIGRGRTRGHPPTRLVLPVNVRDLVTT